ncbi:acyloxyacyl hydrolase [Thiohalomonas denitrificans]|uniref:Lipid A deacylase n=1 Tax=Thiohalomonas denitrificans TaxID=415747 RepID=A0A1G5QJF9_9GAMM|nr:acyloxyacyl hydrolase [Thiohalomonas denitrificans]SCZ61690.1 Lipid A 3-O-deacylase (PagL) [Thiohalomonas denitrificans]
MRRGQWLLVGAMLFLGTGSAAAVDGWVLDGGKGASGFGPGNEGTATRLGLTWDWPWQWFEDGDWKLSGQWEVTAGTLMEDDDNNARITEVIEGGVVGMFRLARYRQNAGGPYVELGVGPHYLSDKQLDGVRLATHFQFQSIAGLGSRFGRNGRFEIGYRIMHLSNAGIETPNPGLNYHLLHLAYRY